MRAGGPRSQESGAHPPSSSLGGSGGAGGKLRGHTDSQTVTPVIARVSCLTVMQIPSIISQNLSVQPGEPEESG